MAMRQAHHIPVDGPGWKRDWYRESLLKVAPRFVLFCRPGFGCGVARLSRLIRVYGPGVYHVTACMNANEPKIEKNLARLATHSKRARARTNASADALYDEYLRLLETKPTKEALEKFSRKMSGFNDRK